MTAPLRVAHLTPSFDAGGSERQAARLIRLLAGCEEVELHAACLDRRGPMLEELAGAGVTVEEYRFHRFYSPGGLRQLVRFARWLSGKRIQILQTHDFYTNVFGMAAARIARVPVRIAARRDVSHTRTAGQERLQMAAYRLATHIVANCEAARSVLLGQGVPGGKASVIYNGFQVRPVDPPADRRDFALPGGPLIVAVGNMNLAVKDQPTLLRAARRVLGSRPDAVFALAGAGRLQPEYERLAHELAIAASVHFLGARRDVPQLLACAAAGVLTSTSEGLSNSIMEYMGAGLPVVATLVGGNPELVLEGRTGFLFEPGDDESLARHILLLLESPETAAGFGAEARRVVAEKFSLEALAGNTLALYRRLLQEPPERPAKTDNSGPG